MSSIYRRKFFFSRRLEISIKSFSIGYQLFRRFSSLRVIPRVCVLYEIFNMNKSVDERSVKRIASFEPREQIMNIENVQQMTVCMK